MIRRFFWFSLGVAVGAAVVWQGTKLLNRAKPSSVVRQVERGVQGASAKLGDVLHEFAQAYREAEADVRRETGLDL